MLNKRLFSVSLFSIHRSLFILYNMLFTLRILNMNQLHASSKIENSNGMMKYKNEYEEMKPHVSAGAMLFELLLLHFHHVQMLLTQMHFQCVSFVTWTTWTTWTTWATCAMRHARSDKIATSSRSNTESQVDLHMCTMYKVHR